MNINWYPGHMKKTRESLEKKIKIVDVVCELLDARIPFSSQNPIINDIIKDKPRIIILNKADLANSKDNKLWKEYFNKKNTTTILMNSLLGKGIEELISLSTKKTKEIRKKHLEKGIQNKPTRIMILGIPNVGKSTLINSLSRRKGTKVGNKPGVTKINQWIKTKEGLELLDTPGILWPKFEDKKAGLHLAFIGSIKDEVLDVETLALKLIEKLMNIDPTCLEKRYNLSNISNKHALDIMEEIGVKRGCKLKGDEIDYTKVSNILLDEFRKGIIGNLTLEVPKDSDLID